MIQLIVISLVSFAGLVLFIRFYFSRQLNSALTRLKVLYEDNLLKENRLKEELERAKQVSQSEIEKGKQQAEALVESAKKEGEELRLNLKEQAKQDAQKILQQGKEDLEKMKLSQMVEIEEKALSLSMQIIKYAFTQEVKETLHHQLIEESVRQLREIDKATLVITSRAVRLITPLPLNDKERLQIREILTDKIGADIAIEEKIDQDLITGLLIQVGELVIDGSFKMKLKKILPYLKKQ